MTDWDDVEFIDMESTSEQITERMDRWKKHVAEHPEEFTLPKQPWYQHYRFPLLPTFFSEPGHWDFHWTFFRLWNITSPELTLEFSLNRWQIEISGTLLWLRICIGVPLWM